MLQSMKYNDIQELKSKYGAKRSIDVVAKIQEQLESARVDMLRAINPLMSKSGAESKSAIDMLQSKSKKTESREHFEKFLNSDSKHATSLRAIMRGCSMRYVKERGYGTCYEGIERARAFYVVTTYGTGMDKTYTFTERSAESAE